jgi:hypothetical protein
LERAAQLEDLNANLENEVSQLSAELAEKEKLVSFAVELVYFRTIAKYPVVLLVIDDSGHCIA